MNFSHREGQIIKLLAGNPSGLSVAELSKILDVSPRTIYREIKTAEISLAKLQIELITQGSNYLLKGNRSLISSFLNQASSVTDNFSAKQRQNAIMCTLLLSETEIKMEALSIDFRVSYPTIQSDIGVLEEKFKNFPITIERRKSAGIIIKCSENERRRILTGIIAEEINEYHFFNYLAKHENPEKEIRENSFFLSFLSKENLMLAFLAINTTLEGWKRNISDSQLLQSILLLSLILDRTGGSFYAEDIPENLLSSIDPSIALQASDLITFLHSTVSLSLPQKEHNFIVLWLGSIDQDTAANIFLSSFDVEFSYRVKEFIKLVSDETGLDFPGDNTLFYDLSAHMSSLIKGTGLQLPKKSNPLFDKIIFEYESICIAIKNALKTVFTEVPFTNNEITYTLLHFAASYEKIVQKNTLTALVICTSGIGSSNMLKRRIEKNLHRIGRVEISKVSNITQLNLDEYDIILSTIYLPGFPRPYKMVSPLLMPDEIRELDSFIDINYDKSGQNAPLLPVSPNTKNTVYDYIYAMNKLLGHFVLEELTAKNSIEETVLDLCTSLSPNILDNPQKISSKLMQRIKDSPFGIPKTNMLFLHTADSNIKVPFVSIYDIDKSFVMESIDGKSINVNRIFLMLGCEPLSEIEEKILSRISSSIIDNEYNTNLYNLGDRQDIYNLISEVLIKEIKRMDR